MIKPGIKTTEFWLTLATHAAWVIALVFHHDFSGYVPAVAFGMAAVATAVYAIARAGVKRPHNIGELVADVKVLEPVLASLFAEGKFVVSEVKTAKKVAVPAKPPAPTS